MAPPPASTQDQRVPVRSPEHMEAVTPHGCTHETQKKEQGLGRLCAGRLHTLNGKGGGLQKPRPGYTHLKAHPASDNCVGDRKGFPLQNAKTLSNPAPRTEGKAQLPLREALPRIALTLK